MYQYLNIDNSKDILTAREPKKYYRISYKIFNTGIENTINKVRRVRIIDSIYYIEDVYDNIYLVPSKGTIDFEISKVFYGPMEEDIDVWDSETRKMNDYPNI